MGVGVCCQRRKWFKFVSISSRQYKLAKVAQSLGWDLKKEEVGEYEAPTAAAALSASQKIFARAPPTHPDATSDIVYGIRRHICLDRQTILFLISLGTSLEQTELSLDHTYI